MKKILEVIVNSAKDAIEAEAGGADRLEVVRDLDVGGLTPDLELAREIATAARIPVRVMLRENAGMSLASAGELDVLCSKAAELDRMGVDGLVAGFVVDGGLDVDAMNAISLAAPRLKITFHRAFDTLPNPIGTIGTLKTIQRIDRILTVGGPGAWSQRKLRLQAWQRCAGPEITILAGAGVLEPVLRDLARDSHIREMHVGRAARVPQETSGIVSRVEVARIKGLGE